LNWFELGFELGLTPPFELKKSFFGFSSKFGQSFYNRILRYSLPIGLDLAINAVQSKFEPLEIDSLGALSFIQNPIFRGLS